MDPMRVILWMVISSCIFAASVLIHRAVSYTHLDVYKRQVYEGAVGQKAYKKREGNTDDIHNGLSLIHIFPDKNYNSD